VHHSLEKSAQQRVQRLADSAQQASDALGDAAEQPDVVVTVVVARVAVAVVVIAGERQRSHPNYSRGGNGNNNDSFLQHDMTPFRGMARSETNNFLGKTRGAPPIGQNTNNAGLYGQPGTCKVG
jgi:hypothetical protein